MPASSISPVSGPTGTTVTITGTEFGTTQGASWVSMGGIIQTPTSWGDTSIQFTVAPDSNGGSVLVHIANESDAGVFMVSNVPPAEC